MKNVNARPLHMRYSAFMLFSIQLSAFMVMQDYA